MKRFVRLVITTVLIITTLCLIPVTQTGHNCGTASVYAAVDNDIVSISAGANMSAAVRSDGSVWTWGGSSTFQRGLAVGSWVNAPSIVCSKSAKAAVVGRDYNGSDDDTNTGILRDDGSLWMFGGNDFGALGANDPEHNNLYQPYKVLENVTAYDLGGEHSAAVTEDGTLYMWGRNKFGEVGNNSTETVEAPTAVLPDVVKVSLGGSGYETCKSGHSAAIKSDGSLWMWGCNRFGQLGNGTTEDSHIPIKVAENVKDVSLGTSFTVILKNDGTVWTCGANNKGQLAKGIIQSYSYEYETHYNNGTIIDDCWPTDVPDRDKSFVKVVDLEDIEITDVEAGSAHAGAVSSSGDLFMWGDNSELQVGNNSSTHTQADPIVVLRNVNLVSLGRDHSLATKNDGSLWAWGSNNNGKLGDCTNTSREKPQQAALGIIEARFQVDTKSKDMFFVWDDNDLSKDPASYNNNLSLASLAMSEGAYSDQRVLTDFGFKVIKNGMSNDSIDEPGYLVGYKVMYDFGEPMVEIVMAIRGTKGLLSLDALTDIKSVNDGFDGPATYCYDRLKDARTTIATELGHMGLSMSKKNTKYLIVGHSYGGACAGKLALRIGSDGLANLNNIYAYTFAAPNYTNMNSQLDTTVDVPGIFNLVNVQDLVPKVPSVMFYDFLIPIFLYKAGTTIELSAQSNLSEFKSVINELYGEVPWDTFTINKAHMTPSYYALLKACDKNTSINYSTCGLRFVSIHCPVDIEVYDSENEICALTNGSSVRYIKESAIRITIIGDEKYIEIPDGAHTIKYKGTDSGSMKIEDQIINYESGEVMEQKVFDDIIIEEGKQFESTIDTKSTVDDTELYVLNEEGDKIKEVDTSGQETPTNRTDITQYQINLSETKYTYDGNEKCPGITVKGLQESRDFTVSYKDNVEPGIATVTIKGKGDYTGETTREFTITGVLTKENVAIEQDTCEYTGAQITPSVSVSFNGKPLTESDDYTIEYGPNLGLGEGTVVVTGKGFYKGAVTRVLEIVKASYDMSDIGFSDTTVTYDGAEYGIEITGNLPDGVSVSYDGNGQTEPGEYTVTARFTGDTVYHNEIHDMTATLSIMNSEIDGVVAYGYGGMYDGEAHGITVNAPRDCTVKYGKAEGHYEFDVSPTYDNVGNYPVYYEVSRKNSNSVRGCLNVNIAKASYDMSNIGFTNKTVTYSGSKQSIEITGDLPDGVTVTYNGNGEKNAGEYTVTASFRGDWTNYYKINNKTAVLTIKAKTNPMTVKAKVKRIKYEKLKQANQTITAQNAFAVSKAKGKVTYKKLSGNKKISISSAGKVTIKKGLRKGTFKVKTKVTAAGGTNYKKGSKTVTLTIKVQ